VGHFYEVILQDRPCWLYFDLEYSIETNPELNPEVAMTAFQTVLQEYCLHRLGVAVDSCSILVLESSTPTKFSKHVLVKRLTAEGSAERESRNLAFGNNAQAGLFVSDLVAYAKSRRGDGVSDLLFVRLPRRERGDVDTETLLIDQSVYSRNRTFRLLFQSKFGKTRRLDIEDRAAGIFFGCRPHPCVALLASLVTFVHPKVRLFQHASNLHGLDDNRGVSHEQEKNTAASWSRATTSASVQHPVLRHLIHAWDDIRDQHEGGKSTDRLRTRVRSVVTINAVIATIRFANNRFCLCKGASHVSNNIYIVLDTARATFCQKCFDPDCYGFSSPKYQLPLWLLENRTELDERTDLNAEGCTVREDVVVSRPAKLTKSGNFVSVREVGRL
jgi:hypothetical protein